MQNAEYSLPHRRVRPQFYGTIFHVSQFAALFCASQGCVPHSASYCFSPRPSSSRTLIWKMFRPAMAWSTSMA